MDLYYSYPNSYTCNIFRSHRNIKMNKELRNKIIKYNRTHSDIIFEMRYLLDDIISSMIKENKGYENLYSKSGNTKTLKKLGYKVLRIWESDFYKNKQKFLKKILKTIPRQSL